MILSDFIINKIINFWFPNDTYNSFWFKQNKSFDEMIYKEYYDILIDTYNILDKIDINTMEILDYNEMLAIIILFDQFSRNINRVYNLTDEKIKKLTNIAKTFTMICINNNLIHLHPINYLIFTLMPLRHTGIKEDYEKILHIINRITIDNDILSKFKYQTIKRYNELL
jgi:uncharacterized protein (DUF924 family)